METGCIRAEMGDLLVPTVTEETIKLVHHFILHFIEIA